MPDTPVVQTEQPLLVHISVVAKQLGLSVYQVKRLIEAGRLPSEPVGVRIYIPAEAVREYAAALGKAAS